MTTGEIRILPLHFVQGSGWQCRLSLDRSHVYCYTQCNGGDI